MFVGYVELYTMLQYVRYGYTKKKTKTNKRSDFLVTQDLATTFFLFLKFLYRQISLLTKELTTCTKKKKINKKRPKREVKNRGWPPLSIRPSPFFFHLASNAFSDIGFVGRIKKKKKFHKKSWRPWYPRVMLKVNIHIFGLTKCTIYCKKCPCFCSCFSLCCYYAHFSDQKNYLK